IKKSRYYKHEKLLTSYRIYEASRGDVCTTLTRRPQSRMAAVQLSFLLFALINNIQAEEHEIKKENGSLTFNLTEEADFCLISRFVDEEKLVLWNTSDLWTKNSTVPEDLKQRLSFVNGTHFSSLMILQPDSFRLWPRLSTTSVEESAELQCTVTDFSDDQPPLWTKFDSESKSYTEIDRNYSLSFPSLTLSHSGRYNCKTSESRQTFFLAVCPTFGPPVVQLFSEGDEVTLRRRDVGE
ncbi:hypothetical protein L3Q82_008542, partial [Scortum barcoo]